MSKRTQAYNFAESLDRAKRVFEGKNQSNHSRQRKHIMNLFPMLMATCQAQEDLDSIPLGYHYTGTFI